MLISIHAPRVGRDNSKFPVGAKPKHFNPRAPCGARQHRRAYTQNQSAISIHAPRVGRDPSEIPAESILSNFNPRAPCGARPKRNTRRVNSIKFQSTRPVWGATFAVAVAISVLPISIHAPRVGRDSIGQSLFEQHTHFNPRAPCGARRKAVFGSGFLLSISIHAPRVGRDGKVVYQGYPVYKFQSTRPVWGATPSCS